MFFQKIIAALLLIVFFAQTFDQSFIELDFLANRGTISKIFCVNRDKPQMHCNGRCYLAKQIQKQQDENKQQGNNKKEKFEIQFFFVPAETTIVHFFSASTLIYGRVGENFFSQYQHAVFHPPCV